MLNSKQNFFKLSNNNFLFKFYNGQFEENFEKKAQSIINILSKEFKSYKYYFSREYEFVFIYDKFSYYNKYYDKNYSNDIFGNNVEEDYQRINSSYYYRDIIKRSYKKYNE